MAQVFRLSLDAFRGVVRWDGGVLTYFRWHNARGLGQGCLSVDAQGRLVVDDDDEQCSGTVSREQSVVLARAILAPGGAVDLPERGEA